MKKILQFHISKCSMHLCLVLIALCVSLPGIAQISNLRYESGEQVQSKIIALKAKRDSLSNLIKNGNSAEFTIAGQPPLEQLKRAKSNTKKEIKELADPKFGEKEENIDLLSRGYVDYFNTGSVQASAQLLRLRIGEPGLFNIPLYIFVGASGDNLGGNNVNGNAISSLINPIGGLFNGSINKEHRIFSAGDHTFLRLSYQLSGKLVSGKNTETQANELVAAGFGNFGFYFQTGAWEETDKDNIGIFWMQTKVIGSLARTSDMHNLFGEGLALDGYAYGYSIDLAIEIDKKVNLKASVYQYLNNESIDGFNEPTFKFSFDHKLN